MTAKIGRFFGDNKVAVTASVFHNITVGTVAEHDLQNWMHH
jgi:hypothetical protein